MTAFDTVYAYAASYDDLGIANADFKAISRAHRDDVIGKFQAGIFSKQPDGTVKIVNTTSTTRTAGAQWGTLVGTIAGVLFPPSVLVGVVAGGAMGAISGNLVKGWGAAELKTFGAALETGDIGIIAMVEGLASEGAPALLPRAQQRETQQFDTWADQLRAALDEAASSPD